MYPRGRSSPEQPAGPSVPRAQPDPSELMGPGAPPDLGRPTGSKKGA